MTAPECRDPLGHLADALVEDILATPDADLLAEVAEDHGDAQALTAEFEKTIEPLIRKFTAQEGVAARRGEEANVTTGAWRTFEWLAELLPIHLLQGGGPFPRALKVAMASVLVFVAAAGLAALPWANRTPRSSGDEFTRAASPAIGQYIVQLSWRQSQEDAVANLLSRSELQARFPSLPADEASAIRQAGRDGTVSLAGFTMEQARGLCEQFKAAGGECSFREPPH